MRNKYFLIRNCPAIYGIDDGFLCSYREDDEDEKYCYDCTDCLLKQIVKKCRKSLEVSYCPIEQEILQLLDIEEDK